MDRNSESGNRLVGVFFVVVGLACVYFFIIGPIREALNGATYITVFKEGAGLAAVSILFGLWFLILGPRARTLLQGHPQSNLITVLLIIVAVAAAIFFGLLPDMILSRLGYGNLF